MLTLIRFQAAVVMLAALVADGGGAAPERGRRNEEADGGRGARHGAWGRAPRSASERGWRGFPYPHSLWERYGNAFPRAAFAADEQESMVAPGSDAVQPSFVFVKLGGLGTSLNIGGFVHGEAFGIGGQKRCGGRESEERG